MCQYISFAWLFSPLHRMPLMFQDFIGFFWLFEEFVLNSTMCPIICANCGILNSPHFLFFFNLQVTCHRNIVEISWKFFHNRSRTAKPCFTRLVLVPRFAYFSCYENWVCGCSNWDTGRTYWNLHLHSWNTDRTWQQLANQSQLRTHPVRHCTHPSRVHRGFTAYVSQASNANCVKHGQFGKRLGTRQYFMLKASLQTDTKWSSWCN